MAGATWSCCHFCISSGYTIQPSTSLQCHCIQSHIWRMQCVSTCHLHFWQNDWDLLCATALKVTCGWNGYWNTFSTKLTQEGFKTHYLLTQSEALTTLLVFWLVFLWPWSSFKFTDMGSEKKKIMIFSSAEPGQQNLLMLGIIYVHNLLIMKIMPSDEE